MRLGAGYESDEVGCREPQRARDERGGRKSTGERKAACRGAGAGEERRAEQAERDAGRRLDRLEGNAQGQRLADTDTDTVQRDRGGSGPGPEVAGREREQPGESNRPEQDDADPQRPADAESGRDRDGGCNPGNCQAADPAEQPETASVGAAQLAEHVQQASDPPLEAVRRARGEHEQADDGGGDEQRRPDGYASQRRSGANEKGERD